jgi:hypothetical protein
MAAMRAWLVVVAVLGGALPAVAGPPTRGPGTVEHTWTVRWPEADRERAYTRKFATRGGLIKRVRVEIRRVAVKGPPYLSIVACRRTRHLAAAQKSWVWEGRNVYVLLLLQSGECAVAGRLERVSVTLTTMGT